MTQCEKIVRHLEDCGSITPLSAMREYGIMRLASRMSDLKRKGYKFIVEIEKGRNRYGEPTHYARYRKVEEDES
jgi:hypothetical protein